MNSLRRICQRRPGTRPARHARRLHWQARSRDSQGVFAEGVERVIMSIANLLPKAPSARDEAVDVVCRLLGALVLARAMPASSSLGRELLATATERCRKGRNEFKQAAAGQEQKASGLILRRRVWGRQSSSFWICNDLEKVAAADQYQAHMGDREKLSQLSGHSQ